jgi:dTDP-4-dehydrorhamnose reductase
MRILVTGKNGQLGQSLHKVLSASAKIDNNDGSNEFIFVGRKELDFSNDSNINHYFSSNNKFDIIINCAAYTAVDKAEEEPELANKINHLAVKKIAEIANKQKSKLIHISTDYVFDGESDKPYTETDTTNPINIYGKTKLAGEKALQDTMSTNAIIIRTSWLYSEFGNNFVNTMLKLGKEQDELNIVNDQIGSPTYATDLAEIILHIIKTKGFKGAGQTTQIYHYSNDGKISWYDFAKEIFKIAKIDCKVNPIITKQYPTPARRPKNTVMKKIKIESKFEIQAFEWKISLGIFRKESLKLS